MKKREIFSKNFSKNFHRFDYSVKMKGGRTNSGTAGRQNPGWSGRESGQN